jgi:Tripartite tricarboxylate transporter TctB family
MEHDATAPMSDDERRALARSELHQSFGWTALGLAVFIASWRMDRLESQNINPYTVPGLLPGLLGIAMMLLGTLLALRSWRRGALAARTHGFAFDAAAARRVALIVGLCVTFGVVLVGHGLPFWLAAAIFVSVAIVVLQRPQRIAAGERLGLRRIAIAAIIGLGAGGIITLVFQQVFLVRLP